MKSDDETKPVEMKLAAKREYATTCGSLSSDAAQVLAPPQGGGWELVHVVMVNSNSAYASRVLYVWMRST
jgi:hypothetical protein